MKRYPKKRIDGVNTCLTECVAELFDLPPAKVPFFIKSENWLLNLQRFFERRGWKLLVLKYNKKYDKLLKGKTYIASGISPGSKCRSKTDGRANHHAVLYKGNKRVFDPSGYKKNLIGGRYFVYIPIPAKIYKKLKLK